MLKDHFYQLSAIHHQDDTITAHIQLNGEHEIFQGHFPGQPVVPGACMLQMVKEILSDVLNQPYQLKKAANLKFLVPVDQRVTDELVLKMGYKEAAVGMQISASMTANEVFCFKMQGIFVC